MRGGNDLQTHKFHQMLHITDYVEQHGCQMNYDSCRGENAGKIKIKDIARLTSKEKQSLNFDIDSRGICENTQDDMTIGFVMS